MTTKRSGKVDVDTPTGKAVATLINQRDQLRSTLASLRAIIKFKYSSAWEVDALELIDGALKKTDKV